MFFLHLMYISFLNKPLDLYVGPAVIDFKKRDVQEVYV